MSDVGKPLYDRGRFPAKAPKGFCRGCRGPIVEPRRQTWCSKACNDKYDPRRVIWFVKQRDKGICQLCHVDTEQARKDWMARKPPPGSPYTQFTEWYKAARGASAKVEYDHIVPFSEGGMTVLENMRTLCVPCHRKVTAEWRRKKAETRKAANCPQAMLFALIAAILPILATSCTTARASIPPMPDLGVESRPQATTPTVTAPPSPYEPRWLAWTSETGRVYFVEEMNRSSPNDWRRVADGLTFPGTNGSWKTGREGNFRTGYWY